MNEHSRSARSVSPFAASPAGARVRTIYLASILSMVSIFALDLVDGATIWLHVLYVFPIAACAFYCEGILPIVFAAVVAGSLQSITLIVYKIPLPSIAANFLIETASAAMVIALTRSARSNIVKMEALSITDDLTRLPNRRGIESVIRREIARQQRRGGVLSLALLDLDRFKELNDRHGHSAGDLALKLIGEVLGKHTRESDSVARLGGDEFVIVMPDTQGKECAALCRNLTTAIARRMTMADLSLTASIGFATFERAPDSVSVALHKADRAMYAAKANRARATAERMLAQRAAQ